MSASGVTHEANTLISDEVSKVVEMIAVIMLDPLSVVVHAVVIEPTVLYQTLPLRPAGRHIRTRILVQVLTEVTCNKNRQEVCRSENIRSGAVPKFQ